MAASDKQLYLLMDNHVAHLVEESEAALTANCFTTVRTPAYSPDFNSIETLWAVVKRQMRIRLAEANHDLLIEDFKVELAEVLDGISYD